MLGKKPDNQRVRAFFRWIMSGMESDAASGVIPGRLPVKPPGMNGAAATPGILRSDLIQLVENARREWQQANALFNEAGEPQLVDHAIHVLAAAEVQYTYYIRQAKEEYQVLRRETG